VKAKNISILLFTALFLGFSALHLASANNDTNLATTNICSTGVLDAHGLCSQPTVETQASSSVNSQAGILATTTTSTPANTYWCKPGTTDSNLCGVTGNSVNSQAGILSQGVNSTMASPMVNQTNLQSNAVNSNFFPGMISPNSLGYYTNPNSVCATGATMQSQGLCVSSQGLQGYYSPANCNFGIDPVTHQCMRTASLTVPQAGILAQNTQFNSQGVNQMNPIVNGNPGLNTGVTLTPGTSTSGLNTQTSPGMMSTYSPQIMQH
jgi:hypothetical protein